MSVIKPWLKKLFPDKSAEIDALPDDSPATATPPSPVKVDTAEFQKIVDTLKAQNEALLNELAGIRDKDASRQKLIEEKAAADAKQKIEDTLKAAIEARKIPAKADDVIARYRKVLESDYDTGKGILDSLPAISESKNPATPPSGNGNAGNLPPDVANDPILATIYRTAVIN